GYFEKLIKSQHIQPFDHSVCKEASLEDLNIDGLAEFFKKERVRLQQDFIADVSVENHLLQLGLLNESFPTYGALLCFSREPMKWISGAFTRCTYWPDNDRNSKWQDDRIFQGSLLNQ